MSVHIVKINEQPNSADYVEYMIDSASDVSSLPTNVAPGSFASTTNMLNIYRLSNAKVWTKVGE